MKQKIKVPKGAIMISPLTDLSISGESITSNIRMDTISYREINPKTF